MSAGTFAEHAATLRAAADEGEAIEALQGPQTIGITLELEIGPPEIRELADLLEQWHERNEK